MKKLSIVFGICILAFTGINAQADNYKAFEWDLMRLGFVLPSGDGLSGGIALSTEPRFNLNDNISLGLRWELAFFGGEDLGNETYELSASSSFALMGDYYFSADGPNRLFAGMGVGRFRSGRVTYTDGNGENIEIPSSSSLGIVPRVGYEIGHLRTSLEYNLLFDEGAANYLGVNFALTLWGGYKG